MVFKMYLLSICDFEDKNIQEAAQTLIDSHRREVVYKYKNEKDRMRAIVAGLLLQAGFLEMELDEACCTLVQLQYGDCSILNGKTFVEYLKMLAAQEKNNVPVELVYEKGEHGKPYWDQRKLAAAGAGKKLWHFNLSHSGEYVVLVVSDTEVGVDIQKQKSHPLRGFPGGYRAFSRMEAYVKCTGEGYAQGVGRYKALQGNVPGYDILCMDMLEEYALYLCFGDCKTAEGLGEWNE